MSAIFDDAQKTVSLSVRTLAKMGSPAEVRLLHAPQSPVARMQTGQAIHQQRATFQREHQPGYDAEVTLHHRFVHAGWTFEISGRADGVSRLDQSLVIEEVKSVSLPNERLRKTRSTDWPAWSAQLHLYLWLAHHELGQDALGWLTLVSSLDGTHHTIALAFDEAHTWAWLVRRLDRLLRLHAFHEAHDADRQRALYRWPYPGWRLGQERLRDAVADHLTRAQPLIVQAPTGLGKTAAVLHGALTWAAHARKSLYWATSRNTQAPNVVKTLRRLLHKDHPLTVVTLRAKEQLCPQCATSSCPYAEGSFERIDDARLVENALARGGLDPERAVALGQAHHVCPFQLLLDVAEHADVVVGDYNFAFRPFGRVQRLFGDPEAPTRALIVDEAHQLAERVREQLSPQLPASIARDVILAWEHDPGRAAFTALAAQVLRTVEQITAQAWDAEPEAPEAACHPDPTPWFNFADRVNQLAIEHARLEARQPSALDVWSPFARALLTFADVYRFMDDEIVSIASTDRAKPAIRLLCCNPARAISRAAQASAGWVALSATLSPPTFFRSLLGLPEQSTFLELPSPFRRENRAILLSARVSTAFRDRAIHADATAKLLDDALGATHGHAAIFFSSFAMMEDLLARVTHTGHERLVQSAHMDDAARSAMLERLKDPAPAVLVGVLGGIFAEGIDPPPGALRLVAIVGPGLPPIGLERDLLTAYYERHFGQGAYHASLVPGLVRVVQAAGRLIRQEDDLGVVLLIGRRFRWREVRTLFPQDWEPLLVNHVGPAIQAFWAERESDAGF